MRFCVGGKAAAVRRMPGVGRGLVLTVAACGTVLGLVSPLAAPAQTPGTPGPEPTYLVERVTTLGGKTQRLSVFRDGIAVLVRRDEPGGEPQIRERQLGATERQVIAQVVAESYAELERLAASGATAEGDCWELRLAPEGLGPVRLRQPVTAVRTLIVGRLLAALDELEKQIASQRGSQEDLSAWTPEVGEQVELADGRLVQITELFDGSEGIVVRTTVVNAPVSQYWALSELRRQALRRVRP